MKPNIELLAPAGSYEAFVAAIQNGANAIYLGGNRFSARASATNFSDEEIVSAVAYAHLRNVRVYVTINTLYEDSEFPALYEYIQFLYTNRVDAIIIQDMGILTIVKKYFPDFEVHISTQASVYSLEGVRFFQEHGAKRVVLARENTLTEIQHICSHTDTDIEVFVHGALCISYSGQCLMSSFIGKRSGNKGACAQPCRLGYGLEMDGKRLTKKDSFALSPKDLCTIEHIGDLIDAGVLSFKIEGRMKRPEYVATIVKSYRKAIDSHLYKKKVSLQNEMQTMKGMFNRGFTGGHIFQDASLMATDYSGNRGIEVGKVVQYNPKRKRAAIRLFEELKQNDRVVFKSKDLSRAIHKIYDQKQLVNIGKKGSVIEIDMDILIPVNDVVYKVVDSQLLETAKSSYQQEQVRIPITIHFEGRIGEPCTLTIFEGLNQVIKTSDVLVEVARQSPLTPERITKQLEKLGSTVYHSTKTSVDFEENATISIQVINQLRRETITALDAIRLNTNRKVESIAFSEITNKNTREVKGITIKVQTLAQLQVALQYPYQQLFFPINTELEQAYILAKEVGKQLLPYTGFLFTSEQMQAFKDSNVYAYFDTVLVGNHGALQFFQEDKNCLLDSSINIYNSYAAAFYKADSFIVSLEMTKKQVNRLQTDSSILYPVYGYVESMVSKYCPISEHHYQRKVIGCNACKKGNYAFIDRKNAHFPIRMDDACNMHLYNSKPLYIDAIDKIKADYLVLSFTIEDKTMTKTILDDYFIEILQNKKSQYKLKTDFTKGYFVG